MNGIINPDDIGKFFKLNYLNKFYSVAFIGTSNEVFLSPNGPGWVNYSPVVSLAVNGDEYVSDHMKFSKKPELMSMDEAKSLLLQENKEYYDEMINSDASVCEKLIALRNSSILNSKFEALEPSMETKEIFTILGKEGINGKANYFVLTSQFKENYAKVKYNLIHTPTSRTERLISIISKEKEFFENYKTIEAFGIPEVLSKDIYEILNGNSPVNKHKHKQLFNLKLDNIQL
jgi:hypothetical protein